MRRYRGNEKVEPGIYFNLREIAFRTFEEDGTLPGTAEDTWWSVPTLVLLVVAPLVGLVYAMFLPFIGFAMLGAIVIRKIGGYLGVSAEAFRRVLRPAWQPARAFLGRRGKKNRPAPEPPKERPVDEWKEETRRDLDPEC